MIGMGLSPLGTTPQAGVLLVSSGLEGVEIPTSWPSQWFPFSHCASIEHLDIQVSVFSLGYTYPSVSKSS